MKKNSTVILLLQLIQERMLSVSSESMCTKLTPIDKTRTSHRLTDQWKIGKNRYVDCYITLMVRIEPQIRISP